MSALSEICPRSRLGTSEISGAGCPRQTSAIEISPQTQQDLIDKGRLTEARAALRRVFVHRQLTPSTDEDARIEACTDIATLERWNDRAFTAGSVSDALE